MSAKKIILVILGCMVFVVIAQLVSGINTEVKNSFKSVNILENIRTSWAGKATDQSGNTWADFTGFTPYQVVSGDSDFGSNIKLIGSAYLPHFRSDSLFTISSMLVVNASDVIPSRIRLLWGETTAQQALTDSTFTEIMVQNDVDNTKTGLMHTIDIERMTVGTKVWAAYSSEENGAIMDFYLGIREYYKE